MTWTGNEPAGLVGMRFEGEGGCLAFFFRAVRLGEGEG